MLSHLNALTFVNWAAETFGINARGSPLTSRPVQFRSLRLRHLCRGQGRRSDLACARRVVSFSASALLFHPRPENHRLVFGPDGADASPSARGKLEERDLSALRCVLFAGEVFPTKHLRALMEKLPHPRYANLYGPTETNVCAWYEVEPLPPEQTAPIPIGKACANTDLIAINAKGKRVRWTRRGGVTLRARLHRHARLLRAAGSVGGVVLSRTHSPSAGRKNSTALATG